MKKITFCRNPLIKGRTIEEPSTDIIKNTLGLFSASPEDAVKYGGELTRAALGAVDLKNDRKYIVIDTKIHMLIPGFSPAIPGWHTDGVPRGPKRDSIFEGLPDIFAQEDPTIRPHRYHLLVTGEGCRTEFLKDPIDIEVPDEPDAGLYAKISSDISRMVASGEIHKESIITAPRSTVVSWDWWNIHQGVPAKKKEWRFLMRVMETDFMPPEKDLRKVIRIQQQVYSPVDFGW